MMITDEHMEWATVDRMRQMLVNVHDDYKVTHTYALFTTILCWVMQRVRANGNEELDHRAQTVLAALEDEPVSAEPWGIFTTDADNGQSELEPPRLGPFTKFDGFTAARFLTALRNAVAHGDARNIRPVNRNEILVGHEFHCSEKDRGQVIWRGRIVLERRDMRRIGVALADRFCEALAGSRGDNSHASFKQEAQEIREAAA